MTPHLELQDATKRYGQVTVLDRVRFDVRPGETHVLAGENGAGKSTLIKILGGVITDYDGTLLVGGNPTRWRSPHDASTRGVAVIHQELSLVPSMTVLDNLFLGEMPTSRGFVRRRSMREQAAKALDLVGIKVSLETLVGDLPIATQQRVEVAKALRKDARVVIMDEPTSALNVQEAERLFELIAELKARGCGIVYISHKMDEIARLADRITVLRDGQWVATEQAADLPADALVRLMVGGKGEGSRTESGATRAKAGDRTVFVAKNIRVNVQGRELVRGVSLAVRSGEVLGLAGLEGSGNSALLLGLFGAYGRLPQGEVHLEGRRISVTKPGDAIRNRIALLTSDRKASGLVLPMSVAGNSTLADLRRLSPGGWRRPRREAQVARSLADQLSIRAASLEMPVGELSGGNQQKAALAKWVQIDPKVMLLDEPTRGIDINAKREIYALIEGWKAAGMAIVVITSELPELLLLSDRILVMHRGEVVTEMARDDATTDRVIKAAMG